MTELSTLEKTITFEDVLPYEEPTDDAEHHTHIINPPNNLHIWREGMSSQELVNIARLTQREVQALCGYRFVPKLNPDKYDACDRCMEIAQELMAGAGE